MDSLKVGIGTDIEPLKKGLNEAGKELTNFGDKSEQSSKKLTSGFSKSSEAVQLLDGKTGGLASSLVDVADAAKLSGSAMKTALVSSGIGVAVVLIGLIVEHWEDIKNLIDGSNQKLQIHIDDLTRTSKILKAELELSKSKEKFLIAEGKQTKTILEARRLIIGNQQLQNVQLLQSLQLQDLRLDKQTTELTLWEKIKNAIALAHGQPINPISEFTEEEKKANNDRETAILKLKKAIEDTKTLALELNIELAGGRRKKEKKVSAILGLPEPDAFFEFSKRAKKAFENIKREFQFVSEDLIKPLPPLVNPIENLSADEQRFLNHMDNIRNSLLEFNEAADEIISNGIFETFSKLGQGIGDALATGGNVLESAGAALLGALGGILTQMGTMAITIGVGLLGIKAALKSLNPAAAIAAGVALIALGSFFSSKSSQIGSSVGSGGSSTGNTGGSGSRSFQGSSVSNSGGGFSGGTVVFEIAGTKLVGVLSNTLSRNRALGGSLSIG